MKSLDSQAANLVRIPLTSRDATGDEPIDLFRQEDPPSFNASLLPDQLAGVATDQAALIGCDPGIIGMIGLGVLAGAIDDRIQIQPKRHDPTWTESARLWVAIIGDPSSKKSPGIAKARAPMREASDKLRQAYRLAKEEWNNTCRQLSKGEPKPPEPYCKRLTLTDTTVESLTEILGDPRAEPRGILLPCNELNGFLMSMDCYRHSAGKDRAKWLEAYDGGPTEVDRVRHGAIWIENWSVSIVGGIQPDVFHAYAKTTSHDGLLQRFLVLEAKPAFIGEDRPPDISATQAYRELVHTLIALPPCAQPIQLSEAAHVIREHFAAKILAAAKNLPNKGLSAMLGKWEGTFARVLLIYHVCECVRLGVKMESEPVTGETAKRVSDLLLRILLPHAVRFYSGLDPAEDNARALAGLLLAKKWDRFTVKRDLAQNMVASRRMSSQERQEMLDRMESYGWITPEATKLDPRGRPSAYEVNPRVHERFFKQAERERIRRREVKQFLDEFGPKAPKPATKDQSPEC